MERLSDCGAWVPGWLAARNCRVGGGYVAVERAEPELVWGRGSLYCWEVGDLTAVEPLGRCNGVFIIQHQLPSLVTRDPLVIMAEAAGCIAPTYHCLNGRRVWSTRCGLVMTFQSSAPSYEGQGSQCEASPRTSGRGIRQCSAAVMEGRCGPGFLSYIHRNPWF